MTSGDLDNLPMTQGINAIVSSQFDSDIMLHAHKCETLSASHEK